MDRKELQKMFKQRDSLISQINTRFEVQISASQRDLLRMFMEQFADKLQFDDDKRIINNQYNRTLLLSVDKLFNDYGKGNNPLILESLITGVSSIMDFNAKYYSNFESKAKLLPIRARVQENVKGWLGIEENTTKPNGYLDTLVKSEQVKNTLKQSVMKMVYGQEGYDSTRKQLAKLIEGDRDGLGALQKYHRNFSYDLYSQIDRATAKTYADDLKFEFAIYEGGIIQTSREFCKDHNGNVYHRTEIEAFNPKVAKQPDYNPFTDLGGYACRHHLNWIPTTLALAMRPDARRFLIAA
jgi:hypothetical protein